MYCTNCGSKVAGENPKFCQNCGSPVAQAGEGSQPEAPPPAAPASPAEPETPAEPAAPPAPPAVPPPEPPYTPPVETPPAETPVYVPVAPEPAAYAPPAETPGYVAPPAAAPQYAPAVATPPATAGPAAAQAAPKKKGTSWCCWAGGCGCLLLILVLVIGGIVAYPRLKDYIEPYVELSGDPDAIAARLTCQGLLMAQDQRDADAVQALLHPKLAERLDGHALIDEEVSYTHEIVEQTRTAPTDFTIKVKDTPTSGEDHIPLVWLYTFRTDGGQWKLLWFDLEGLPNDELPDELKPEADAAATGGDASDDSGGVNKVR